MDDPNDFEWGFPKAKYRASNGTLYDTPPRFTSNWSAKCGSKWPTFVWMLSYHPRCIYIQVNMLLQLIVAEIWAWTGTLMLTRTWVVYGYGQIIIWGEQWGATGIDVTGSDMTGSHMTGSDVSHVTGINHHRSILCACATGSCAIFPFDRKWQSHVNGRGPVRKCPLQEVDYAHAMLFPAFFS